MPTLGTHTTKSDTLTHNEKIQTVQLCVLVRVRGVDVFLNLSSLNPKPHNP
jgi:hypothetical protein